MLARRAIRQNLRLRERKSIEIASPARHQTNVVRLGKKVIARRYSARRVRNETDGTVVKVLDGSTFVVRLHGYGYLSLKEVRLLGVDAPEVLYDECYSEEARSALENLILDQTVWLEKDDGYLLDSYRRSLHFVRTEKRDVGAWMILNGYAMSDAKTQHSRFARYEEHERLAREADDGLWSYRCDYDSDTDQTIEAQ